MEIENEKPVICYETDIDESFLVGTKKELSDFAYKILNIIEGESNSLNFHGIETLSPKSTSSLSESIPDIVLDGLLIVRSKKDKQDLVNKIRINNGMPPIDWLGRENDFK